MSATRHVEDAGHTTGYDARRLHTNDMEVGVTVGVGGESLSYFELSHGFSRNFLYLAIADSPLPRMQCNAMSNAM